MKHLSRHLLCALLLLITPLIPVAQNSFTGKPTQKPLNQPGEDADFQRYLASGRTSVVVFYADWCPTCRGWAPILDAVNTHFPDMQVLFMDIREWDTPVAEKYGIHSIPHFKIFDPAGRPIVEGQAAKEWLRQAIDRRLQASARGTYRLSGQPARLNVAEVGRSETTRPRGTVRGRASAGVVARLEKIESNGPLPSVDQVIDRYVAALGGQDAAMKFSTRSARGKVNVPTMGRGSFVMYAKAPNKVVTTIEIPEVGVIKQGFNGAAGWTQSARTGVRPVAGAELLALKRDADFYSPVRLKTNYPRMRLLGVSKIGFREAYVIEARPLAGEPERLYFSKESGLIIRWDAARASLGVSTAAEIYLDDWTEVDGIKMPFTITQLFP